MTKAQLQARVKTLEEMLYEEEKCAEESGGILSDVCDILFNDPNRAATHGYEGVIERAKLLMKKLKRYKKRGCK